MNVSPLISEQTSQWLRMTPAELSTENGCGTCGVCEGLGSNIFWCNPHSVTAHKSCYREIQSIEEKVQEAINDSPWVNQNWAHRAAIHAVQQELGGRSIKVFWAEEGAERLKEIFDRAGVAAVHQYARTP